MARRDFQKEHDFPLHSAEETRHIIERWSHIKWDNENISNYDKEKDFSAGVQQIRNGIDYISGRAGSSL